MKRIILLLGALAVAIPAFAQLATGSIYGRTVDQSGAAVAGATVTLAGSDATQTTTSDEGGAFRFLNVPPGTYRVTATLTGFSSVTRQNVVVAVGSTVEIPLNMKVAAVAETIEVTAESPVVDTKKVGTATNFSQDELAKIPNSRDPWALLRTVPGALLDRVNIAGNESGQQSSFKLKGTLARDGVWSMDGVNITDMAATGASPTYFDYDAFEEIQIATGGMDIRQSTGGVGLNFVTKRGTNAFHGTARGYFTHKKMAWSNVPGELAARGITPDTADHNSQVADYGADLGGPIVRDKLWFWGSYGRQDIRLVRSSGNLIDRTVLADYNLKLNWQATKGDMVNFLFFNGAKLKYGRSPGNAQVEPDSATWNQGNAYEDKPLHGLFKLEDNHVFNPNFFLTGKYAYYNTGFSLTPRGGLDQQQATISALLGRTFGSTQYSGNIRPQHTGNLDGSYFTNAMGGNNEIKFGAGYRYTRSEGVTIWPADKVQPRENSATDFRVRVYRDGLGINNSNYLSFYLGDSFTKDRLVVNLGVRYDRQWGKALPSNIEGNKTFSNLVPGISFNGYDTPFTWSDVAPRVGATYALDDGRKTVVRGSYSRYATQLAPGTDVGFANPSGGAGWAEYPWNDLNGDHFATPNEITITPTPLATGGGFNPAAPTSVTSADTIDPNYKAPRNDEFILGLDRELFPNFGVSLSYTHQRLARFRWTPRNGMLDGSQYTAGTPVTGTLQDGTAYSIPIFLPVAAAVTAGNSGRFETNQPGYRQTFNGLELSMIKRLSNKWMMRLAGAYNNHQEYWDLTPALDFLGNPTRRDEEPLVNGGQVSPRTSGSGTGDVFLSGKWTLNVNGLYQLPWNMEVAANLFGRQGTAYPIYRNVALGLDGTNRVLVSGLVDTFRFKEVWNLDMRLSKNFRFGGRYSALIAADLFNVTNSNVELNRQRNIGSTAFNQLTSNLSPRILRLGIRLNF
jgi:hypothetical protein